jgi:hypothetical protein
MGIRRLLHVPRQELERRKVRKVLKPSLELLTETAVLLKCAGVNLYIRAACINSAALEDVCPPPGHGRKNQGNSRDHHPFTYIASAIGVESRIKDD